MCVVTQHIKSYLALYCALAVFLVSVSIFWLTNALGSDNSLKISFYEFLRTSLVFALAAFVVAWTLNTSLVESSGGNSIDTFFKAFTPVAAAVFFIYQMLAGAFAATTSVSIVANRSQDTPSQILVNVTVERGDNWVVEILKDEYRIIDAQAYSPKDDPDAEDWIRGGKLHRRNDERLLLSPKEKTSAGFVIAIPNNLVDKPLIVVAKISSFASWWPTPVRSFATAYIPPAKQPDRAACPQTLKSPEPQPAKPATQGKKTGE